ncbi:MAG: anion permease [Gracilibacteraceae bacterium]|jgi:di/tricarboxylate transporter|nr:anion permease [Gracilibacteraceae bacterium]
MSLKKLGYVCASALFLLCALNLILLRPLAGLNPDGQIILGGTVITLWLWIFRPFQLSFAVGGLFMAMFALARGLAPAVVFAGFTQAAVWTLVPALFFGYCLHKTGLGRRLALFAVRLFRPSCLSVVFACVLTGVLLSLLTPSITVRIAIMTPIAVQCCEILAVEKNSKANSLVMLTAFAMALVPGAGWLSGSLWGPIIKGMMDSVAETEGLLTFSSWSAVLLAPVFIVTVLLITGGVLAFAPKRERPEQAALNIRELRLGPPSREEILTAVILVLVFISFLTGRWHGLPDAAICLAAVFCLFSAGVLRAPDFNAGVNWDLIVFIGMALGMGVIFSAAGVTEWLALLIVPAIAPLAQNPWLFCYAMLVLMFVWRFVDVANFLPTMAILAPILPAVSKAYHISPLVWIAFFIMAGNSFFMSYQNMWALLGYSFAGERAWPARHLALFGLFYFAACLLALLAAVPLWLRMGLFAA